MKPQKITQYQQEEGREESVEDDSISLEGLNEAIKNMKIGKVQGMDEVVQELITFMGIKGKEELLKILNMCWKKEDIPEDGRLELFCP